MAALRLSFERDKLKYTVKVQDVIDIALENFDNDVKKSEESVAAVKNPSEGLKKQWAKSPLLQKDVQQQTRDLIRGEETRYRPISMRLYVTYMNRAFFETAKRN